MYLKNQLVIVFMLCVSLGVLANGVTGKVTDSNNEPLSGASVRILNSSFGTVTDESGNYSIQKVKGEITVQVSFIGFKTQTVNLALNESKELNVSLEDAAFVYDDVVVSATRVRESDPFASTLVTKEQLQEQKAGEALPILLNVTPSLVSYSENGTPFGNTAFRIRGSDPSRINITVDGVPLNDPESQAVFWVNMTDFAESVEDIQIQRGVGTSTNGTSAFGASVNLQTTGYNEEGFGLISTTLGSYNTQKMSAQVNTGLLKEHFVFNARLSKLSSDGYIDHSGMEHNSFFVSGGYFSDKTKIRLKVFGNEEHTGISWWGIPDYLVKDNRTYNMAGEYTDKDGNLNYYENQKDNYWQNHVHLNWSQVLTNQLNLNTTLFYTKGKGYYEQFQDDDNWLHDAKYSDYGFDDAMFIQPGTNDTLYSSDLTRQKWLDNDFYGANVSLEYSSEKLSAILGLSGNRYEGEHFGKILWAEFNPGIPVNYEWYTNNSVKDDYSAFIKGNYQITDKLSAYADVQLRAIQYTMNGSLDDGDMLDLDLDYTFLNPKAGISYETTHHQAFVSYAMANREPSRANLKDAAQDLKSLPTPETLHDFELGYTFRQTLFSLKANAFYMLYKDQLVPTGEKNSVGYDIMTNVPDSYRAGIELAGVFTPASWLKWEANATFSKNIIENFVEYNTYYDSDYWNVVDYRGTARGNTSIAYSPNVVAASIFTFYPTKGLTMALTSKYVGEQYFDNTGQDEALIDAYFVNDFMVSYKFPIKLLEYCELKFKINNVFDTDYIANGYGGKDMVEDAPGSGNFNEARWTYYYPQAFRNFLVQLNVRF